MSLDLAFDGSELPPKQEEFEQHAKPIEASEFTAHEQSHIDEPPPKKRKIEDETEQYKSSPRPQSPPWKKITADGPTMFLDKGRRRSGRTNMVPLEQQPPNGRRRTRAAYEKLLDKHTKSLAVGKKSQSNVNGSTRQHLPADPGKKGPGRPPKIKTEDGNDVASKTQRARPVRQSSRKSQRVSTVNIAGHQQVMKHDLSDGNETNDTDESSLADGPLPTFQKVKFRVALPKPAVMAPQNVPRPRKYATFDDFLANDPTEPFTGQDSLTKTQVSKEALARFKIYKAKKARRIRGTSIASGLPPRQLEPARQFAHFDHLLGHIHHFRNLLRHEQKDHRRKAEQLAYEAKRYVENKRQQGRVKSAEEIAQEQLEKMRQTYRTIVKDIAKLWGSVEAEVVAVRRRQYEEEQQAKIKGHLNRVLDRADQMLQRREGSETDSDAGIGTDVPTEEESEASDSEDISESSSDSGGEAEREDIDADLTAEELRSKYENLPDVDKDDDMVDIEDASATEDSDPETEMDSEFDSNQSDESQDISDERSGSENESGDGLMSLFFSKKQLVEMKAQGTETPEDEFEDKPDKPDEVDQVTESTKLIEELPFDAEYGSLRQSHKDDNETSIDSGIVMTKSRDPSPDEVNPTAAPSESARTSPQTSITKHSEADSTSSFETQARYLDQTKLKTPVPSLLRGQLREYQHEGLDWLANLYASGRNGILADEMGLGKTIQSIALLAHLACDYGVWGPHLIVVPTSVMLNWEIEFKKFLPGFKVLTYYGTLEERKQKRRGWMADDSFNVCITSYQLVLQDANSFKRRRWHCMILDEAHNIKNFRSERWQTMMTFNTRARLLLTGTPLQNNLTELWSLLFFLHYGQEGQDDDDAFAGLKEWSEWFKRPVESILEHGQQVLDQEDKEQVAKLHKVIRPFLLRRLKADVEKQMPLKYEHVELCRLSKRQRQLYDGFMSRAQTKETLASGNYLSIINALMQLRKVCNHPDLFETRPINTSFAMPKSVAAEFEIKDLLVRRKLLNSSPLDNVDLDFLQLAPISNEKISTIENVETLRRHAYGPIKALRDSQWQRLNRQAVNAGHNRSEVLTSLDNVGRRMRLQDLDRTVYYEAYRHHQRPIWGRGLLQKLYLDVRYEQLSRLTGRKLPSKAWEQEPPIAAVDLIRSIEIKSSQMAPFVEKFACLTPAVVATDLGLTTVTEVGAEAIRKDVAGFSDPFHQARMKLSIAFPDKRLLQYDCGKLQRLDRLLRRLQSGGHRALIFTQMTKMLDILEQFLNIHGHRYLRLDGATKIEQRQILTDRFNSDTRILAFILSSRSGGLGINLTGADTVIFYDLDWNPAMDKQCTDRAHRIGQTRDVHIYRFVSEHTIESNILRKANQKQLLDNVVIQKGDFTTDYFNKVSYRDMLEAGNDEDMAGAAMDRVLGNDKSMVTTFEQAEDREDASAAKVAVKEVQHANDGDFDDQAAACAQSNGAVTPGPYGATNTALAEADDEDIHHIDEYLLKVQTYLLKDVPLGPPKERAKRGRRPHDEHRRRRARK